MSKLFHYTYVSYLHLSDPMSERLPISKAFDYTWLYELDLTNWNTISHGYTVKHVWRLNLARQIHASDSF